MRPGAGGLRRRFRLPRRLRATFEGKAFLLITLGVGIAAINTGNNLLYLALSMNLALVVVSGFLSEWALRRVSLSARGASEAFAGQEAFLAVACSAFGKRFPSVSLTARFRIGDETLTVRFPDIAPRGTATRVVPYLPARRGRLSPAAGTLSTRFPFSLFEKTMDVPIPADLLVYPRPAAPDSRDIGKPKAGLSENPMHAGRSGAFPRGARELLPMDPVRNIHWKATARMGRWMVKEREAEIAPAVELRVPVPCPPGEFEARLSAACGAVLDLDRRGIPYRLWIGDRLCADARDTGGRSSALAALATAQP
ncbi:MAG: DUF58 domain-containing protein [Thermodesulfobacteriota bacterium]